MERQLRFAPNELRSRQVWQERKGILAAYCSQLGRRQTKLLHATRRFFQRHERIVAAEQNLTDGNELRQRCNGRRIGRPGNIVVEAREFEVDAVWRDLNDVLGRIVV